MPDPQPLAESITRQDRLPIRQWNEDGDALVEVEATIEQIGAAVVQQIAVSPELVSPRVPLTEALISVDTTLNREAHAGRMLKLLVPNIALFAPADFDDIGDGFNCTFANISGGNVVMSGMTHVLAHTRIAAGAVGAIIAVEGPSTTQVLWTASATLP